MKLFPRMELAVKAMALCCENEEDGKARCGDVEKSPIARSEVFNETWMLRLTLALIHDHGVCSLPDDKNTALSLICNALPKRWISEGGLEPAFKKEGTTWTDAILGDVRLRGESADDGENTETASNKRKVEIAGTSGDNPGVVIVEAKIGSPLDKSVTNSKNYDQVARNIACLAKLLLKVDKEAASAYLKNSAVVVFMPNPEECPKLLPELDDDQKNRMGKALVKRMQAARSFFKSAQETIENQGGERAYDIDEGNLEKFKTVVKTIFDNSTILTWDEIIDAIADENENKEMLKNFYIQALKEIVPKKREWKHCK